MSERITEQEELFSDEQDAQVVENSIPIDSTKEATDAPVSAKPKFTKKKIAIIAAAAAAVAIIAIAISLLVPSKFEKVRNECTRITGRTTGGGDYFVIDTCPDIYDNMDEAVKALLLPSAQEYALEAIKYANKELGFNGSVYSQMMNTSALMGRQSAENSNYRVSWTYHPDDGLEVTYEKK